MSDDDAIGIIMERCDMSLQGWINTLRNRGLAPLEFYIWILIAKIAEGLSFLHFKGVVHRDIKPDNILLAQCMSFFSLFGFNLLAGTPKISDFGLSKFLGTQTGLHTFCGTQGYIAPECLTNNPTPSSASDVFSLGKTIEQLLFEPESYSEDLIKFVFSVCSLFSHIILLTISV